MPLNILVCIKQVPATSEVEIDPETGTLKRDSAAAKINPYDLYALEMALALKEEHGGVITSLSMGPPAATAALRETLEIGADRAVLLCDRRFAGADVLATSRALAAGARKIGAFDLILCGKQTTDGDTAQVGAETAEHLGIPHACYVHSAKLAGAGVEVVVNLGDREQVQAMPLPCLLTVEKDVNTPRLPSFRRRLAAKDEDIVTYSLDDLGETDAGRYGLAGSPTKVERIFAPDKAAARRQLTGSAEACAGQLYAILAEKKFV